MCYVLLPKKKKKYCVTYGTFEYFFLSFECFVRTLQMPNHAVDHLIKIDLVQKSYVHIFPIWFFIHMISICSTKKKPNTMVITMLSSGVHDGMVWIAQFAKIKCVKNFLNSQFSIFCFCSTNKCTLFLFGCCFVLQIVIFILYFYFCRPLFFFFFWSNFDFSQLIGTNLKIKEKKNYWNAFTHCVWVYWLPFLGVKYFYKQQNELYKSNVSLFCVWYC